MSSDRRRVADARRIVVKLGTRLLAFADGKLNVDYFKQITGELAALKQTGRDLIIVSSGAVGAGMGRLGLAQRPTATSDKQAVAAVGQGLLIQLYEKLFADYGHTVAQILLTREDIVSRRRCVNAVNTVQTLLKYGAIPIINENDTISVEEIEFGDNDTLSALVAGLVNADLLVILSDVDGLYTANPRTDPAATLIPFVSSITTEIKALAGAAQEDLATGGMITKLQAAEIAVNCGINMVIANGRQPGNLARILQGEEVGTLFAAGQNFINSRKRWIAFCHNVHGTVSVDSGASAALKHDGKSLLPIGITDVSGHFERGDMIRILDENGRELARGLSNYSSAELAIIKGQPSGMIGKLLGYTHTPEVVHRDNLVIS